MILKIHTYGDPILKKISVPIKSNDKAVQQLIEDMYETMYNAQGVGLAAPQIGKNLRLFIVDGSGFEDHDLKDFKETFINPEILIENGKKWDFSEGCLSIPGIREDITRMNHIRIRYFDRDWKQQEREYYDLAARVIQHEYDHINGVLFTDHLNMMKRRLLKSRLTEIIKGKTEVAYPVTFVG